MRILLSFWRMLVAFCIWEVLVIGSLVLVAAMRQHALNAAGLFDAEKRSLYFLISGLGVLTIGLVTLVTSKLRRTAAAISGLVVGALASILAGLAWGSLVVRGFEGPAVYLFLGLLCAVPSGVASAIAGLILSSPSENASRLLVRT